MSDGISLGCIAFAVVAAAIGFIVAAAIFDSPEAPCLHEAVAWTSGPADGAGLNVKSHTVSINQSTLKLICTGTECPELRSCTLPPPPGTKVVNVNFYE